MKKTMICGVSMLLILFCACGRTSEPPPDAAQTTERPTAEDPVAADEFTSMLRNAETAMSSQQAAKGNTLKSYEVSAAAEAELWGAPVLVCDAEMLVSLTNSSITVFQRSIRITGSCGTYIFSLSAFSRKSLEEATDELVRGIKWK